MHIYGFAPESYQIFLLILVRVSVILFLFPVFSSSMLPSLAKAGLAFILTLILYPVLQVDPAQFPRQPSDVIILLVVEFFIGMVLALGVRLFFGAIELAGQIIGFQMGFSIINVIDPQTGTHVSIMGRIGNLVVLLVFLLINGHHLLISALVESFAVIPFGMLRLQGGFFTQLIDLSAHMFVLSIKIASPAMVALLFTSAAFGLSAKFAPQMNILIAAFPVKIVVGLIFFGMSLQIILVMTKAYVAQLPALFSSLITWMGTG